MSFPVANVVTTIKELSQFQQEGKYKELEDTLLTVLERMGNNTFNSWTPEEEHAYDIFSRLLMKIFSDPKFTISSENEIHYVKYSILISNLVSMSSFKNTDIVLKLLIEQRAPLNKILTLYSGRNRIPFNIEKVFEHSPLLTYTWWTAALGVELHNTLDDESWAWRKKLVRLKALKGAHNFFRLDSFPFIGLFVCTYVDHTQEKYVKSAINEAIIRSIHHAKPLVAPDYKKIFVLCSRMMETHAVYKSLSPLLKSLKGHYELVLVDTVLSEVTPDIPPAPDMFDRVINGKAVDNAALMKMIQDERPGVIIYPEIGMNALTVMLSNLRLAPIQIAMYGHPVSSYAPLVDYYIVSRDAEKLDALKENYSERAVALPGTAAISIYPRYERRFPVRQSHIGKVLIACSWGALKMHLDTLKVLRSVIGKTKTPIVFRFNSIRSEAFAYIAYKRQLEEFFGAENVECMPHVKYEKYMYSIEEADFALDSYPFGGFNRTIDTLYCGKPMLTWEGDKLYNRLTACMFRRLGLEEMVAASEKEFMEKIIRLADDASYRADLSARVRTSDVKGKLCNAEEGKYMKKAVDYLIAHHDELQRDTTRQPIFIEE